MLTESENKCYVTIILSDYKHRLGEPPSSNARHKSLGEPFGVTCHAR